MRTLLISLIVALTCFTAFGQSNKPERLTLEGQFVCSQCWSEADRKTTPYGTAADMVCAEECAGGQQLTVVSLHSREQLDGLGATGTRIVLSGDLDEYAIAALRAEPVDSYGVGTSVVTGSGAPTASLVYKLVEVDGRPVAKRSTSKESRGGAKSAVRRYKPTGTAVEEVVHRRAAPDSPPLELGPYDRVVPALAGTAADGVHVFLQHLPGSARRVPTAITRSASSHSRPAGSTRVSPCPNSGLEQSAPASARRRPSSAVRAPAPSARHAARR